VQNAHVCRAARSQIAAGDGVAFCSAKLGQTMSVIRKTTQLLAVLSTVSLSSTASAQFARQEVISVASYTTTLSEALTGTKGSKALLAGYLRLAKPGPKQPVVVLMHGAGGMGAGNSVTDLWSRVLNEAGISTFNLDGYAGRGINTLAEGQNFPAISRVLDAYAALAVIAKHPLVDPTKIAVMGFSQGGAPAMYSNLARFHKMYGEAKFAAHISVYGLCGTKYQEDEDLMSPMLIIHGEADDWVPMGPCREYAERLMQAGKNVRFKGYADAHHGFDALVSKSVKKFENASTSAWCRFQEGEGGIVANVDTGKPLAADDACRRKGLSFGYNEAATKQAQADVVEFLKEVFN
jgi:dienelactone hydrolase